MLGVLWYVFAWLAASAIIGVLASMLALPLVLMGAVGMLYGSPVPKKG